MNCPLYIDAVAEGKGQFKLMTFHFRFLFPDRGLSYIKLASKIFKKLKRDTPAHGFKKRTVNQGEGVKMPRVWAMKRMDGSPIDLYVYVSARVF